MEFEFEDDPLRARVLSMLGAVRVADTAQLHRALTPHLTSPAYVRRVVMQLLHADLVGRVPRGRAWVWHLTETGRRALVEAGAPERRRAATGEAALRSGLAAHALTVTATAIEFARHGWGEITDWAVEVAHPIEGGRVTTDAVLTLEQRWLRVEVDRKSMAEWRLIRKVAAYGRYATHRVHVGPRRLQGSTRPAWQAAYPGPLCPSLLVVLAGAGRAELDRHSNRVMRAALKVPAVRDGVLIVNICRFDALREHGPDATIWANSAEILRRGTDR
ncbi:replication-relaxation family protein [Embleya sp. NPDC055664]